MDDLRQKYVNFLRKTQNKAALKSSEPVLKVKSFSAEQSGLGHNVLSLFVLKILSCFCFFLRTKCSSCLHKTKLLGSCIQISCLRPDPSASFHWVIRDAGLCLTLAGRNPSPFQPEKYPFHISANLFASPNTLTRTTTNYCQSTTTAGKIRILKMKQNHAFWSASLFLVSFCLLAFVFMNGETSSLKKTSGGVHFCWK